MYLAEQWPKTSTDEKHAILSSIMKIVAKKHNAGLTHKDIRLDSFLYENGEVYLTDGEDIQPSYSATPLDKKKSLKKLSSFFSKLFPKDDDFIDSLYRLYANIRGWNVDEADIHYLKRQTHASRKKRIRRDFRKIFRTCDEFIRKKSLSQLLICHRKHYAIDLQAFLNNPDSVIDAPNAEILQDGKHATVCKFHADGRDYVVKRYFIRSLKHGLKRAVTQTRAVRSWRNSNKLFLFGFPTPKPVALLEKRFGPFRNKAYFVCEYIEGESARSYFKENTDEPLQRELIRLFRCMADLKITHGDMKGTNFLIVEGRPYIIDLDSMRHHWVKARFNRLHKHDVSRFMRNWKDTDLFQEFVPSLLD